MEIRLTEKDQQIQEKAYDEATAPMEQTAVLNLI